MIYFYNDMTVMLWSISGMSWYKSADGLSCWVTIGINGRSRLQAFSVRHRWWRGRMNIFTYTCTKYILNFLSSYSLVKGILFSFPLRPYIIGMIRTIYSSKVILSRQYRDDVLLSFSYTDMALYFGNLKHRLNIKDPLYLKEQPKLCSNIIK